MKAMIKKLVALLMVVCCLSLLALPAFAEPDNQPATEPAAETEAPFETETPVETEAPPETEAPTEPDPVEEPEEPAEPVEPPVEKPFGAFTPNGNLTLVDDFYRIEGVDEEGNIASKQFITLQSKAGNTFFLVIDRVGEVENVYFMNLVDEADLFALISEEDMPTDCTCKNRCTAGHVDTTCPVCRTNMSECTGKAATASSNPDEPGETTETEQPGGEKTASKPNSMLGMVVVIAVIGAGAGIAFFVKSKKKKQLPDPSDFADEQEQEAQQRRIASDDDDDYESAPTEELD